MQSNTSRFEFKGYEGRIVLGLDPFGNLDGCCTIYQHDKMVALCVLQPEVFEEAEASAILRRVAEEKIDKLLSGELSPD